MREGVRSILSLLHVALCIIIILFPVYPGVLFLYHICIEFFGFSFIMIYSLRFLLCVCLLPVCLHLSLAPPCVLCLHVCISFCLLCVLVVSRCLVSPVVPCSSPCVSSFASLFMPAAVSSLRVLGLRLCVSFFILTVLHPMFEVFCFTSLCLVPFNLSQLFAHVFLLPRSPSCVYLLCQFCLGLRRCVVFLPGVVCVSSSESLLVFPCCLQAFSSVPSFVFTYLVLTV